MVVIPQHHQPQVPQSKYNQLRVAFDDKCIEIKQLKERVKELEAKLEAQAV